MIVSNDHFFIVASFGSFKLKVRHDSVATLTDTFEINTKRVTESDKLRTKDKKFPKLNICLLMMISLSKLQRIGSR